MISDASINEREEAGYTQRESPTVIYLSIGLTKNINRELTSK